jgi:hypothetical protein
VYGLSIEHVAASYGIAKSLSGPNRHIRILKAFSLMDEEANRQGKSQLIRIVSMLTRLIQRTDRVTDAGIEYEYRDAEYE